MAISPADYNLWQTRTVSRAVAEGQTDTNVFYRNSSWKKQSCPTAKKRLNEFIKGMLGIN